MDIKNIKALAQILNDSNLSYLEVTEGETKIKLKKANNNAVISEPINEVVFSEHEIVPNVLHDFNKLTEVTAPLLGVFYSAPSPETDPYVSIGSKVKKGDVLCIVEAMKLMNEITADRDGEIIDICVKNEDIVEFGQVLFKLI